MNIAPVLAPHVENESAGSRMFLTALDTRYIDAQPLQILQNKITKQILTYFPENFHISSQASKIGGGVGGTAPDIEKEPVGKLQVAGLRNGINRTGEDVGDQYSQADHVH